MLAADRLQIALGQADYTVELSQFARLGTLHILHARIEPQQLRVGRIARLLCLQPGELFRARGWRHFANYAPLLIEHLITARDMLWRHAMAIEHDHTPLIDVTI